jgi:MFS family permease
VQTRNIIAIALLIGTPLFIYFGWWSDKIGRKMIMMVGMLLAVFLYRPIYQKMYDMTDVSLKTELAEKKSLVNSVKVTEEGDSIATHQVIRSYSDGSILQETTTERSQKNTGSKKVETKKELTLDGVLYYSMIGLVLIQVVLVTMVYGPIAAFLVELFPTRIRYTSMSLPYHIGNGIFGGLTPLLATSLFEFSKTKANPSGDPLAGLWYPIVVAGLTFIVGMVFLSNKKKGEVMEE